MGANIKIKKFNSCSGDQEHSREMRLILEHGEVETKKLSHVDHAFYYASGVCPTHTHEQSEEIFLFTRGTGVFHLGGKDISYKPGDIIYVPQGVEHGLNCDPDSVTEHVVCCVFV